MKRFDDKDLIAYHLHELSPRKTRALERALQADPLLLAESEAYATTLHGFKANAATVVVNDEVLARNWSALQSSLPAYRVSPATPFRWHLPALAGAGLALAAASFFVATHRQSTRPLPQTTSVRETGNTAPSISAIANSGVTAIAMDEEQSSRQQQGHAASLFAQARTEELQYSSPQRIATLMATAEPAPVLHFIPLASTPLPAFSAAPPLFITIEPAEPAQTTATETPSKFKRERISFHHDHITDLLLAVGGTLIHKHSGSDSGTVLRSEGASHAVSVIAAFHQQLRPAVGYRIAVSSTRPDFDYGYGGGSTFQGERAYELAATYVVQGPHYGILSTSAEAGGGLMEFQPTYKTSYNSDNFRGAAVVGVAAEVAITKHIALHAAYRAQAFKAPDFQENAVSPPATTTVLFNNEPSVGITYRFSHE